MARITISAAAKRGFASRPTLCRANKTLAKVLTTMTERREAIAVGGGRGSDAREMSDTPILTAMDLNQLARFDEHWRVILAGGSVFQARGRPGAQGQGQ